MLISQKESVILKLTQDAGDIATQTTSESSWLSQNSHENVFMIEVPAKIWYPRIVCRYTTSNLDDKGIDIILLDHG